MPPLDWSSLAQALPGRLLVERLEMPIVRGRIYLPDGVRTKTRSSEAVIVSVGEGVDERLSPGTQVLISPIAGRTITFGVREERKLVDISAGAVLAIIPPELADAAVEPKTNPYRHHEGSLEQPLLEEPAFGEGDRRGLR
jgi:co-chaperonin GroES (HSP10)